MLLYWFSVLRTYARAVNPVVPTLETAQLWLGSYSERFAVTDWNSELTLACHVPLLVQCATRARVVNPAVLDWNTEGKPWRMLIRFLW